VNRLGIGKDIQVSCDPISRGIILNMELSALISSNKRNIWDENEFLYTLCTDR